jgi:hypothetical protein
MLGSQINSADLDRLVLTKGYERLLAGIGNMNGTQIEVQRRQQHGVNRAEPAGSRLRGSEQRDCRSSSSPSRWAKSQSSRNDA